MQSTPQRNHARQMSRRTALKLGAGLGCAGLAPWAAKASQSRAERAVETAHEELWRRMIDGHGVMLDFTDAFGNVSIPTPEECRLGKPNALGWWSPIENGAMFNGLYLDGLINRLRKLRKKADAEKVRLLANGLMFLASMSSVKGFVGRSAATDGKSHYAMGSNDQTLPWFYGLWRYLATGLATKQEQQQIEARLIETGEVIFNNGWRMPAEEPFRFRGGFNQITWEGSPRMLFITKLLHQLTRDPAWQLRYLQAMNERPPAGGLSRLEICERGMVFEHERRHSWTGSVSVAALRALWEMETEPVFRAVYERGLLASAKLALESLPLAQQFDNDRRQHFETDWRKLNQWWTPQQTVQEAVNVARKQVRELGKMSPQRYQELTYVREPLFAAWVVTLAPERSLLKERERAVETVVGRYRYERLYHAEFFAAENAWWRLRLGGK